MAHWAEGPFELISDTGINSRSEIPKDHPVIEMAKSMALTHNIILRSINASYNQCLDVKPETSSAQDFLQFNRSLCEVINIHHDVEEEYLFLEIERLSGDPHIMDANIKEHEAFHDSLEAVKKYAYNTLPENYDGEHLKALLLPFGQAVVKHLHHEIPTLLDLHIYDAAELARISKELARRSQARSDKKRHLPLFVGCADRTFKLDGHAEQFPPIPTFVLYIFRYIFEPKYAGAWKFNPCDGFMRPRPRLLGG